MPRWIFNFCFLFFLFNNLNAQTWEANLKKTLPAHSGVYLGDIAFSDKYTGVIVGSKNYLTTDAGKTWQQFLYPYTTGGRIKFVNDSVGYIIGYNNLVLRTSDGGLTWKEIKTAYAGADFLTLFCPNDNEVFIMGAEDADLNKYGNYIFY
jgi:photosystem II stability/assembly factor-like uncharacterized protein